MKYVIIQSTYQNNEDLKHLNDMVKENNGKEIILEQRISLDQYNYFIHLKLDLSEVNIITGVYDFDSDCDYFESIKDFIDWYNNVYLPLSKYKIIKHLPHASLNVPEGFIESLNINKLVFEKYNLKMSDVGVNCLFKHIDGIEIIPKYSRLYCDVERFKDKNLEPMEKLGQGYIYNNYYDGYTIKRNLFNKRNFKEEIDEYYDNYHNNFNEVVKNIINEGNEVLILDLHSYSDTLADSLGKTGPYPDICIGIDEGYYNTEILNAIIYEANRRGLSIMINYPYKGSLVPNGCFDGSIDKSKVKSIMIEVNKRVYL